MQKTHFRFLHKIIYIIAFDTNSADLSAIVSEKFQMLHLPPVALDPCLPCIG